jgi:hypothetical protein
MTKKTAQVAFRPPAYLKPESRAWIDYVLSEYTLDQHHFRLLTLAAEAWETGQEARAAIAKHSAVYVDRFGAPHSGRRYQFKLKLASRSRESCANLTLTLIHRHQRRGPQRSIPTEGQTNAGQTSYEQMPRCNHRP